MRSEGVVGVRGKFQKILGHHFFIKAKLDALLFEEETLRWVKQRLKLFPMHEENARRLSRPVLLTGSLLYHHMCHPGG